MQEKNGIHVVYIITKLELGGAQKVCLALLEGMQSYEYSSTLITSSSGSLINNVKDKPNIILLDSLQQKLFYSQEKTKLWQLPYRLFKKIFQEFQCLYELIKLLRTLKKQHNYIVVHTHSTKAGLLGRWAAFFAGIKTRVHTIHGFAFHEHQSRILWFAIYMLELITSLITTHFVCVSSYDVRVGSGLFPRFVKKHSIIRAAIDWNQFYIPAQQINWHKRPFVFGTIACFKPQKNLFDLLQAFARVHAQEPESRLEIIGDGMLRPTIEQWITERELEGSIRLHGWQNNVVPIMTTWHAFVLSSLWEGLPCAVVEGGMLKLPVISYNTGGISDVILHNKNGFLCEQKNWQKLAEYMLQLMRNEQMYNERAQFRDDLTNFQNTYMVQQHKLLYYRFQ